MTALPSLRPPGDLDYDGENPAPPAPPSPRRTHGSYRAQLHVPDGRGGRVWVTVIEGDGAVAWVAMQQRNDGLIPMLVWPDPHTDRLHICHNPGGRHHTRLLGPDGFTLSPFEAR